jgi:hypothetical protein
MLKLLCNKLIKKGRKIFSFLPFFLFVVSCSGDLSHYGRVNTHGADGSKNSFTFLVKDDFISKNSKSPQDKKNPKMTEAEVGLLTALLKEQDYCLNKYGNPVFTITSRQEKVYDMTFAHLIEQNYNARPIVPRTYFGQCVQK